jgi:hypothetical protein
MKPPPVVPPPARAEEPPLSLGDPSADAVLRSADREAAEEAGGLCGGENWTSLDRLISSTSTFDLTSFSLLLHKKKLSRLPVRLARVPVRRRRRGGARRGLLRVLLRGERERERALRQLLRCRLRLLLKGFERIFINLSSFFRGCSLSLPLDIEGRGGHCGGSKPGAELRRKRKAM